VGRLFGRFEQPVWGAVLDAAIADAITLLPDNQQDQLGRGDVVVQLPAGERTELSTGSSAT
jgi:hypothetical protein